MSGLAGNAAREVEERHAFFVEWFTGRAPREAMARSARAFAPDMRMIGPDGSVADAAAIVAMLQGARGSRGAAFAIRCEIRETAALAEGLVRLTYDEHQTADGEASARRSTAIFSAEPSAPCGVVWRFLQETWIDCEEPDRTGPFNKENHR